MIDVRRDIPITAKREISRSKLHIEPRRRFPLLKQLRIENATVEAGGRLGVWHRHAEMFEACRLQRQVRRLCRRIPRPSERTNPEPREQLASAEVSWLIPHAWM